MELRTIITKYTYCKAFLLFCYVLLAIIGSGSTFTSDMFLFENNLYNKAHNQQYVIQPLSTNINNGEERSNIYWKRQVSSQTGTRKVHWAPVAYNPDKYNSKEESIERARIWDSQPLDRPNTASLANRKEEKKIDLGLRFNFQTPPRPTKKRNRNVFQIRRQSKQMKSPIEKKIIFPSHIKS